MNVIGYNSKHRIPFQEREAWVGMYMDHYLYPYISTGFKRNNNSITNIKGIDVYVSGTTDVMTIDEKAAFTYVDTGLDKFALELRLLTFDNNNNSNIIDGWLLSNSINSHVGLIWIDSADTRDGRFLTGSGITDCTMAIIPKYRLLETLSDMGWTESKLREKARLIREAYNRYGDEYWKHINCGNININGCHFFIQTHEPEKAVNVQLSKSLLISISDYSYRIKNNIINSLK